jgi:phosphatidylinositol-3,4,5-trisphosphate 3-phosphatase/dual-specificity protein phosphatase PTEN
MDAQGGGASAGSKPKRSMFNSLKRRAVQSIRSKVSQNKSRVNVEGWDLDLSYVTRRIIAMGFPAVGKEAMYRNPRLGKRGVVSYLDHHHKDRYKVFNICAERKYQYAHR